MSARNPIPFRADHVGSLLRPAALRAARKQRQDGAISAGELALVEDDAIRDAVRLQEGVGLEVVTDGEFRRSNWSSDFLTQFTNVRSAPGKIQVRFRNIDGERGGALPGLRVEGRLERPRPIFVESFKFLKSTTRVTPKVTIPSPTLLHFRGGRSGVDETAYPEMEGFFEDLAKVYAEEIRDLGAAGLTYLQIDETNFAYLCDPFMRDQVRTNVGEDPDELPHTYAKLINAAIRDRPAAMTVCMHLCRGNAMSGWMAEGGYEPVAEVLFNEIDVTGYFLEYDSPRAGDFAPLRFLPKGKTAVLGLLTTKFPELEAKDELKRRIEEAARYVPLDQLALSPQCGFASTLEGNKVTVEDEIAKLRLVVEVAREVWG